MKKSILFSAAILVFGALSLNAQGYKATNQSSYNKQQGTPAPAPKNKQPYTPTVQSSYNQKDSNAKPNNSADKSKEKSAYKPVTNSSYNADKNANSYKKKK